MMNNPRDPWEVWEWTSPAAGFYDLRSTHKWKWQALLFLWGRSDSKVYKLQHYSR